ncbi:hypothetical protein P615_14290 [Brevibacillus laterosporus PE36]|nr:hypothetical protein P615_14290 [Brevibacillus laterosporus PE36]
MYFPQFQLKLYPRDQKITRMELNLRPDGFIAWNTSDESSLIPNIEKTLTAIMLP